MSRLHSLIKVVLLPLVIYFSPAGALECARIFQSGMVLPHGRPVPVWGNAEPGGRVQVIFKNQLHTATADSKGRWQVTFTPLGFDDKGAPMRISSGDKYVELDDILVGEAWLASGQSNMQWTINQTINKAEIIPGEENPGLRLMNLTCKLHTGAESYKPHEYHSLKGQNVFDGKWERSTSEIIGRTSAVGYLFAKELQEKIGIPVGLIANAVGGTGMESWIPLKKLASHPALKGLADESWMESPHIPFWARNRAKANLKDLIEAGEKNPGHPFQPGFLFTEGVEWITPFPVTGILWYQGETNAELDDKNLNKTLLTELINSWRHEFGNKELPFVMIQLPRIKDDTPLRANWPQFREVQDEVTGELEKVSLVCTLDLGSTDSNVHPSDKKPVAARALAVALQNVYGRKEPVSSRIIKISGKQDKLILKTDAVSLGTSDGGPVRHFEISGKNGIYHPATVIIRGDTLILSSPKVPEPAGMRYAWSVFLEPNLVNQWDLPLFPCRMRVE